MAQSNRPGQTEHGKPKFQEVFSPTIDTVLKKADAADGWKKEQKKVSRWRQRKWRIGGLIAVLLVVGLVCCAYAGVKIQQQKQQNGSPSQPEPTENVVKVGFDGIVSSLAGSDSSTVVKASSSTSRAVPVESLS